MPKKKSRIESELEYETHSSSIQQSTSRAFRQQYGPNIQQRKEKKKENNQTLGRLITHKQVSNKLCTIHK